MLSIKFPAPNFKYKLTNGKEQIWDEWRKKWVRLTPEEWVRQNFIQYLIQEKKYPSSLISIEKEINLGELKKRYDIAVYKNAKPWLLIECKEMEVALTENVLQQVLRYNSVISASYIVVTNGLTHYCWALNNAKFLALSELPNWTEEI